MNPSNSEASGMQLPPPMEQAPTPDLPNETEQPVVEQAAPAAPEKAVKTGQSAPAGSLPPINLPQSPPDVPVVQNSAVSATTTPALSASDDADLIEKEWVNKAKQIVEQTRDDPYKQSEELTVVKSDYMKKRYNKTLKLNK
jgi:hypothetical protein